MVSSNVELVYLMQCGAIYICRVDDSWYLLLVAALVDEVDVFGLIILLKNDFLPVVDEWILLLPLLNDDEEDVDMEEELVLDDDDEDDADLRLDSLIVSFM